MQHPMNGYCLRAQVVTRDHESTFYKYNINLQGNTCVDIPNYIYYIVKKKELDIYISSERVSIILVEGIFNEIFKIVCV